MEALEQAISVLRAGGVIAHATETCYGFACDAFNEKAIQKLYALKKMPMDKPVSILVSDVAMAKKYGVFNKKALELVKKYWPGPLTLVLKRKKTLPDFLNHGTNTIGMRVPGHKLSRELVKKFGRPITTTSANITTLPSPYSVLAIRKQFVQEPLKPDLIIASGLLKKNPPSTMVDVSGLEIKIIRQGEIRI